MEEDSVLRDIVNISDNEIDILRNFAYRFNPHIAEIKKRWFSKFEKVITWKDDSLNIIKVSNEKLIDILFQCFETGNYTPYYIMVYETGKLYFNENVKYYNLLLLIHMLEEEWSEMIYEQYRSKVELLTVLNSLDHLFHNNFSIIASAYFNKKNEEIRNMNERLLEHNKNLQSFAYTACHDLRNPLNSMRGFSSLLLKKLKNNDPIDEEKLINYLERINNNAIRMETLINNLLELTSLGKKDFPIETIDISKLIKGVIEQLDILIKEKDIDLIIDEKLPCICNNQTYIERIFKNLIENSVKYTQNGKKGIIKIWSHEDENFIKFIVEDNGIGIDQKNIEKIFQPFVRLEEVSHIEGTGIGLAIVDRIIKIMNGNIQIESSVGSGTKFSFTLPKKIAI